MELLKALLAGVGGALALTILHETARRVVPHAPRVDVIGQRAIARPIRRLGYRPSSAGRLYAFALTGDIVANSLYYTLVAAGTPRHPWRRALVLGLAAGVGAVTLPPVLGLGRQPGERPPVTQALTVLWYLTGAMAAAGTAALMVPGGRGRGEKRVSRAIQRPQREPAVVL